jgi:hypothetical protein
MNNKESGGVVCAARGEYEEAFAALQAKFTFFKRAESYLNCR